MPFIWNFRRAYTLVDFPSLLRFIRAKVIVSMSATFSQCDLLMPQYAVGNRSVRIR